MSNKFIFTEIKDHDTAKIGDDWYKLDLINGQILYKIQYNLMEENSDMELQPAKYNKEQKYEIYGSPQKYYIIRKNNLAGVIDENSNIIIGFPIGVSILIRSAKVILSLIFFALYLFHIPLCYKPINLVCCIRRRYSRETCKFVNCRIIHG